MLLLLILLHDSHVLLYLVYMPPLIFKPAQFQYTVLLPYYMIYIIIMYTAEVWKVARYTSASPIFFGEFENYVDGGLLANNPCLSGFTEIQGYYRLQGQKLRIALVVSVGQYHL